MQYLVYPLSIIAVALQAFDAWTTVKILAAGGKEQNKGLAWLMKVTSVIAALVIVKVIIVGVIVWLVVWPPLALWYRSIGLLFIICVFIDVVIHNEKSL